MLTIELKTYHTDTLQTTAADKTEIMVDNQLEHTTYGNFSLEVAIAYVTGRTTNNTPFTLSHETIWPLT